MSPHRSGWRRRGTRTRRLVAQGLVSGLAVAGSLYLFGGLRDFRADRDRLTALAADYMEPVPPIPVASAALARLDPRDQPGYGSARAPDPPAAAAAGVRAGRPRRRRRRCHRTDTAAADSARIGGTAGEADPAEAPAMEIGASPGTGPYPDSPPTFR